MKPMLRSFPLVLAALIAATAAFAAPETLKIDPSHSVIGFQIRHIFSKTPGRFRTFDGTVQYDAKNFAASSVDVTIQPASVNTENERRDADLRSENFFEVEKFPTATFKSSKIVVDGGKTTVAAGDKFKILGDLTIKGITKPVTLDATFVGAGPLGQGGRTVAGFEASTTINRKDFNIVWNRTLDQGATLLGDDVAINLQIEAKVPPPPPPAAADAKPAGDAKAAEAKSADAKTDKK